METPPKKSILLVEDEAITAMLNTQDLQKYGYSVTTVNTGEKAVDFINKNTNIDLILMDIDLGKGIDGTQAAEQILSKHDIPVVFLSSHTEPEVVEKTEKITSYGYVVKNSSITVLDASIKMAFKLFEAKVNEQLKEAKLHENEQKFRLLHENAGIGIGYYSLDGIVLSYNQLAAKHMNGVPEDFIGKSIYELFPKKDAEGYHDRIKKASLSENPNVYHDMVPLLTGNKFFLSTFTKIQDNKGNLLGIQIISQDITDRIEAEEALRESKQKAELLLNVAAEIIISLDSQGDIMLLNESGHRILGYESPELIGKNWFETCLPEENREETKVYLQMLMEGKTNLLVTHENDIVAKNGKRKTILWHNYMLKNKDDRGLGLFSSGEDITNRRITEIALQNKNQKYEAINKELQASVKELQRLNREHQITQETLRENEEKFRFLHEYTGLAVSYYTVDGIVISFNQLAARNMNGVPQDFFGKSIFDIFPEKDAVIYLDRIKKSAQSENTETYVDLVQIPKGNIYFHSLFTKIKNSNNEILGIQIMSQDITERIKKEEEIDTYAARIDLTMRAANVAWWEMDIPTGNVVFAKQKTDMLGYESGGFKHYSDFIKLLHPDDSDKAMTAMRNHFSGIADKYEVEYRILSHDGDYKWFYDIGSISTRDTEGKPLKVAGIVIDITERKQEEMFANLNRDVLHILNEPENFDISIQKTMSLIKNKGDYDAVAIRLEDGNDYPYYTQEGFTQDFLKIENSLLEYDKVGGICTDKNGNTCLECTCGLVISGKADTSNSLFTTGGSFWTNDSVPLLDLSIEDDPRNHPRNTCIHQKYFSVALIPIRTDNKIVGLLQINDFQKDRFTLKTVELFETIASYIGTALIRKLDDKKIKSLLSEKELILKEVHHRIKNNMNTIYGLLILQANATVDQKTADTLNDAANRVKSMMLLYDKLYKNSDVTTLSIQNYLPTLCEEILSNFQNKEIIKIEYKVNDFVLSANILQPLGIIINELITNIMKYAFIDRKEGLIIITATLTDNRAVIIIADNGNGIPESVSFEKSTGFGLVLVNGLTQQLGGTIRIERGQGTKIVLEFER